MAYVGDRSLGFPCADLPFPSFPLLSRTRTTCAVTNCVNESTGDTADNGTSSKSVPVGAIAGPVVAVMVLLSIGVWWWLRKKKVSSILDTFFYPDLTS